MGRTRRPLLPACGQCGQCRCLPFHRRAPPRMCGIIGVFKHEGDANVEIYEGLLMLQHRGQDSGTEGLPESARWRPPSSPFSSCASPQLRALSEQTGCKYVASARQPSFSPAFLLSSSRSCSRNGDHRLA